MQSGLFVFFFLREIMVTNRLNYMGLGLSFLQRQVARNDRPGQRCKTRILNTGKLNFLQNHFQGRTLPHGEQQKQRKIRYPKKLLLYVKNPQAKPKTLNVKV